MYRLVMSLIETNGTKLKPSVVVGMAPELPMSGSRFFIYKDGDDKTPNRYILTSVVQKVTPVEEGIVIKTENSIYLLSGIKKQFGKKDIFDYIGDKK